MNNNTGSVNTKINAFAEMAFNEGWSDQDYIDEVMYLFTMEDIYKGCDRTTYNWFLMNEYRRDMYPDDEDWIITGN